MTDTAASTQDYYDGVADTYYRQYQRDELHALEEYPANYFRLQILVRQLALSGARSVFEVGVGEGTPLATMASMGMQVAGCDISMAMVTQARKTFETAGLAPDAIQFGDIEDAVTLARQASQGPYDAVIAAGVLPHVRNDALALRNIGMLVRPGGKVMIEFRNVLFSLFTLNRYTKAFMLDDLLAGVPAPIKDKVAMELDRRLAVDQPPIRRGTAEGSPGYDEIPAKFHNPFELIECFANCGYANMKLHWYHYHPVPPMIEDQLGTALRDAAIALEHEGSWRGYFLCSAGVVEADRL